jgi:hypothetical protein
MILEEKGQGGVSACERLLVASGSKVGLGFRHTHTHIHIHRRTLSAGRVSGGSTPGHSSYVCM